jgi:hypothetical protein
MQMIVSNFVVEIGLLFNVFLDRKSMLVAEGNFARHRPLLPDRKVAITIPLALHLHVHLKSQCILETSPSFTSSGGSC